jgi:LmbE family N-acetylglucosaminyl deacetylase
MSAILAVFAHPDDETFRPGGTLALLSQEGVGVRLVTATRGECGSCGDPPLCTPEELPGIRERELVCACAALGIPPPRLLDHSDGKLREVLPEKLITEILTAIHESNPKVMLSFGLDGLSGHPDHITIGACTAEAFRRSEKVAALYTLAVPASLAQKLEMRQIHPVPDNTITLTVDVSSTWQKKLAAMRCHATQWSSSPMIKASEERQRLFFGQEFFIRAASRLAYDDFLPEILRSHLLLMPQGLRLDRSEPIP